MEGAQTKSTGLGIAGFVLGLLSIILFLFYGWFFAIIGLIFSIIQIKKNKTKLAIAGLILSIIGIFLGLIFVAIVFLVFTQVSSTVRSGVEGLEAQSNCIGINLQIVSADAVANKISITGSDMSKIKGGIIFIDGLNTKEVSAEELDQEIYLDINSGDKIEIAPILEGEVVCAISSSKIVE